MQMRASFGAIISDYFLAALASTFDCAVKIQKSASPGLQPNVRSWHSFPENGHGYPLTCARYRVVFSA
jgi:hypothetical protein